MWDRARKRRRARERESYQIWIFGLSCECYPKNVIEWLFLPQSLRRKWVEALFKIFPCTWRCCTIISTVAVNSLVFSLLFTCTSFSFYLLSAFRILLIKQFILCRHNPKDQHFAFGFGRVIYIDSVIKQMISIKQIIYYMIVIILCSLCLHFDKTRYVHYLLSLSHIHLFIRLCFHTKPGHVR